MRIDSDDLLPWYVERNSFGCLIEQIVFIYDTVQNVFFSVLEFIKFFQLVQLTHCLYAFLPPKGVLFIVKFRFFLKITRDSSSSFLLWFRYYCIEK